MNHCGKKNLCTALAFLLAAFPFSCARNGDSGRSVQAETGTAPAEPAETAFMRFLDTVCAAAELPPEMTRRIKENAAAPAFLLETLECLNDGADLHLLVDKSHPLPAGYAPRDLVELGSTEHGYRVNRAGFMLRRPAAAALEELAAAARLEGITLAVGSAYRSYDYQVEVYSRIVNEMGTEQADRESARPGYSQHQTGLTVDFSPIDDRFAGTPAGQWLIRNAAAFGWSMSFPEGYETVTGYRGESWHYRFLGKSLAAYTETWFGGIQQYALRFLNEWVRLSGEPAAPF